MAHTVVEAWEVQNLMYKAGTLEALERIAVQVQKQYAGESGGASISDWVWRQSVGRIPSCWKEILMRRELIVDQHSHHLDEKRVDLLTTSSDWISHGGQSALLEFHQVKCKFYPKICVQNYP